VATNEQVNIEVLIQATKSAKTIAQLEKSIDDVNGALASMEDKGSDSAKALGKAIDKGSEKMLELALSTNTATATIGELEKNSEALSEKLKGVERGTAEFDRLSGKLIETNRELKNVELSLEALDSEQVASELGSVAGAVGDVTSAFILMGGEGNETLEEIGRRIETAIAVAIGFKGAIEGIQSGLKLYRNYSKRIKESAVFLKVQAKAQSTLNTSTALFSKAVGGGTLAVKGFRTALISTGIGAIVVAVGLLVANFEKLSALFGTVTAGQKLLNDVTNKAVEIAVEELNAVDLLRITIEDETISREDKNKAIKELQETYPDLLANIDLETASTEELNDGIKKYIALVTLRAEVEATAEIRQEKFKEKIQNTTDAVTGANVSWTNHIATLSIGISAQQLANFETAQANAELNEQIGVLDDLDKANKIKIHNIEIELGLDVASKKAKKDKDDADKNADKKQAERDRKAKQRAQQSKTRKEQAVKDEAIRLKNLATLEEEFFQRGLERDEDREARKLGLEFQTQIDRIKELVKNDEKRTAILLANEENFFKQLEAIEDKYQKIDDGKKQELLNKATKNGTEILIIEDKLLLAGLDNTKENAEERAKIEKRLLDLRIKQIEENSIISLQADELTKDERIKIEKQAQLEIAQIKKDARDKDLQATQEAIDKQSGLIEEQQAQLQEALTNLALETAQLISDTYFEITNEQAERESENRIDKLEETFEAELDILNRRVEEGVISQKQADREALRLEKQKNKALEREQKDAFTKAKKRQKTQAIINGALAFTNALATTQPLVPLGLIAGAGVLISTGLQISKIESQKYARGGILDGPKHQAGGIRTPYGELEGGEAVINRASTKLFKSELSRINQAGGGRTFATGGILGEPTTASTETTGAGIGAVLSQLNDTLRKPIRSYVVEQEITESQARVSNLEANADL